MRSIKHNSLKTKDYWNPLVISMIDFFILFFVGTCKINTIGKKPFLNFCIHTLNDNCIFICFLVKNMILKSQRLVSPQSLLLPQEIFCRFFDLGFHLDFSRFFHSCILGIKILGRKIGPDLLSVIKNSKIIV